MSHFIRCIFEEHGLIATALILLTKMARLHWNDIEIKYVLRTRKPYSTTAAMVVILPRVIGVFGHDDDDGLWRLRATTERAATIAEDLDKDTLKIKYD